MKSRAFSKDQATALLYLAISRLESAGVTKDEAVLLMRGRDGLTAQERMTRITFALSDPDGFLAFEGIVANYEVQS